MFLVLGVKFESGVTGSIGIDDISNPDAVAEALYTHLGCFPDEIFIMVNGKHGPDVVRHWNYGKEYCNES